MTKFNRLPLVALWLAATSLLLPACGHKKDPVAGVPAEHFQLPKHFERQLNASEEIMIPAGGAGILVFETTFKHAGIVHDLRPLESIITISDLPEGVQIRHLGQFSSLRKSDGFLVARNAIRIDLIDAAIGQSFTLEGLAQVRETFSTEHVLDEQQISQSVVVVAYEPDMEMVQKDREAALFYVKQSLANYDQLTKNGHEVPWEPVEIEALLDNMDPMEAGQITNLWKARRRAEEARRHLNAATNSANQEVASFARQALQDVDKAFEEWKKDGVGKQKKEEHVDQLWAEDKLDRRYASIELDVEEHFSSNIDLPTIARPWLTPISMGVQLESRFGAVGPTNHRSTAITETLSGQLAIHDYFWVALRLPMYTMKSQTSGSKWTTGLLNPAVTLGTGYVQKEHWRVRLEVEFMPNIGQGADMFLLEYLNTEMPGSATNAHVLSLNPSVELAASQFTLAVLTGVQLSIGDSFDTWFRYAVVGGVWLHKRFALQLDGRGRVQLNGDQHLSYGTFGFSAFINIHKLWNMEIGVTTPLGDNSNQSSMQFYLTVGCGRWGTFSGKMKAKKEK